MANLLRITTTKANSLLNGVGSYSINTDRIKKVVTYNGGSLIYYLDGVGKFSGLIKIYATQSRTVVNAALSGSLDMQISVNVLSIDGANHIAVESIKTKDILYGKVDSNINYCWLWILEAGVTKKYKLNNTLSSVETAANNYSFSGGGGGSATSLILTAPNGDIYDVTVDNDGYLTLTKQ